MVSGLPVVTGWVFTELPPPTSDALGVEGIGLGIGSVFCGVLDSVGFFTPTPPLEGRGAKGVEAVGGAKLGGPGLGSVEPWG